MHASNKPALTSKPYDVEDFAAAQEFYHSNGWTDGLPIVPPTAAAVEACLEWAVMPPDQLIGIEPVRAQPITAEKLAINAVMAGCLPMHFPAVATAWQAMMKDEFLLHGTTSSTGGCAVLVILNGPIRREIGANSTFNALANSDRATAVIGRALRLALINLLDVRPGGIDRSTFGHPGKFSYCLAEDEEDTSWQPLSVVRGIPEGASAVTVMAAMAPRQIMNEWTTDPKEILETFAAEMRANQRHYSIYGGNYAIVIAKQLREPIEKAGWTKADIAEFVYERARVRRGEWADVGKGSIVRDRAGKIHTALASPDHLLVIAAGGPAGGFGAVIPPWMGSKTKAVTAAIGACVDCEPPKS
ncbi:MAG TPA: hypothetical protein VKT73_11185 [Xanthobacteraceae bacterium]|nr:hypothetical protein [Xanthobacteraceae bacterium]